VSIILKADFVAVIGLAAVTRSTNPNPPTASDDCALGTMTPSLLPS